MSKFIQVDFNINHYVYVRLTPHGKECLRKNYNELASFFPDGLSWEFTLPKEDKDGWSKWQMHDLMDSLGRYVGIGRQEPFETNIRMEVSSEHIKLLQSVNP
jgi:hypothetical protein